MGGGARWRNSTRTAIWGRSPRGRGSQGRRHRLGLARGSIPAWAGEPLLTSAPATTGRVDPRVGGGADTWEWDANQNPGRSPRGRGSQRPARAAAAVQGSIPAWAGEPRRHPTTPWRSRVDPRVGGGALLAASSAVTGAGRSPRGRGSRNTEALVNAMPGSIPAWAGEPRAVRRAGHLPGVDPRVGGGANDISRMIAATVGRSPRGRGSREPARVAFRFRGSIPAWAGEPTP